MQSASINPYLPLALSLVTALLALLGSWYAAYTRSGDSDKDRTARMYQARIDSLCAEIDRTRADRDKAIARAEAQRERAARYHRLYFESLKNGALFREQLEENMLGYQEESQEGGQGEHSEESSGGLSRGFSKGKGGRLKFNVHAESLPAEPFRRLQGLV